MSQNPSTKHRLNARNVHFGSLRPGAEPNQTESEIVPMLPPVYEIYVMYLEPLISITTSDVAEPHPSWRAVNLLLWLKTVL